MASPLPLPDTVPYGIALAERVAQRLMDGGSVSYSHPYYCGMGLWFENGHFCYDEINDGRTPQWSDLVKSGRLFVTRHEFVEWFAEQSDHSLAGFEKTDPWYHQNQRITRDRLRDELGCW